MKSESKHSPGPWHLETVATSVGICHKIGPFPPLRPADGPSHACIYVDGRYRPNDDPVSLANARLIAAAPELLAACKLAVAELGPDSEGDRCWQAFKALTDAITKAEGA